MQTVDKRLRSRANSADNKLIFSLFLQENRIWYFMQIVSTGDNLLKLSNPVLTEK